MKKLLIVPFLFLSVSAFAEGPAFSHTDPTIKQEFENAYKDLRNKVSKTINESSGTITSLTVNGQLIAKGTTTNDDAATGYIGEYISSATAGPVTSPGSNQYFDLVQITLTAGDWDVVGQVGFSINSGTVLSAFGCIGTVSGNDSSGCVQGDTMLLTVSGTGNTDSSVTLAGVRKSISATTTYYLKSRMAIVGSPQSYGRISARRVR